MGRKFIPHHIRYLNEKDKKLLGKFLGTGPKASKGKLQHHTPRLALLRGSIHKRLSRTSLIPILPIPFLLRRQQTQRPLPFRFKGEEIREGEEGGVEGGADGSEDVRGERGSRGRVFDVGGVEGGRGVGFVELV